MKKNFNKKVLSFALLIALMLTVVAYAYTEGVGGSISKSGNNLVFNASVSTTLQPYDLKEIELYHEGSSMSTILFRTTKIDKNQYYNSLSDTYTKKNAPEGIYTSIAIGKIDHVHPNYADFIDFDESEYHHHINYIAYKTAAIKILNQKNKEASDSFNIDLNSYTEIRRDNPVFKKDMLFLLCPQVEATEGDSIPTIFLDDTNNSGIVLKQDKDGLKYKYSFVKQGDEWIVIDKEVSK